MVLGAVQGGISGGIEGALNGAVFGAFSAGIAHGVGTVAQNAIVGQLGNTAVELTLVELSRATAHGVTQGGIAELQGGSFSDAFVGAFTASMVGHVVLGGSSVLSAGTSNFTKFVIATAASGTVSELTGGKFANGAWTAAFVHLFNHDGHAAQPTEGQTGPINFWFFHILGRDTFELVTIHEESSGESAQLLGTPSKQN